VVVSSLEQTNQKYLNGEHFKQNILVGRKHFFLQQVQHY
jgi:hypothetical protein